MLLLIPATLLPLAKNEVLLTTRPPQLLLLLLLLLLMPDSSSEIKDGAFIPIPDLVTLGLLALLLLLLLALLPVLLRLLLMLVLLLVLTELPDAPSALLPSDSGNCNLGLSELLLLFTLAVTKVGPWLMGVNFLFTP